MLEVERGPILDSAQQKVASDHVEVEADDLADAVQSLRTVKPSKTWRTWQEARRGDHP